MKTMTSKILTTLAAVAFSGAAQAATLTFDELSYDIGSAVTSFNVDGITGTISATGGVNQAIIFDSNRLSGGDDDLVAPFYSDFADQDTPIGRGLNPGNILIIAENTDFSDPDDNGSGGTITFNFDVLVDVSGFRVFDDVTNFIVRSLDGQTSAPTSLDFDNQFADVVTDFTSVSSLTFDFGNASGAIDNIQFTEVPVVPVPASLPLLLAGLGALGFANRRKSRAS